MKPSEIEVGKTYRNRGAGKTTRTVTAIGDARMIRPLVSWGGSHVPPREPVVQFQGRRGKVDSLYLSSFASWAGSVVEPGIGK
jgi:hypothetical protein